MLGKLDFWMQREEKTLFKAFCYVTYTISNVTIQSILCSIREKCKKNCTKYLVVSKKAVLLYPEIANDSEYIII